MDKDKINKLKTARILTIQIAVESVDTGEVEDEISYLLSEEGVWNPNSKILDWTYLTQYQPEIEIPKDLEEGEIFGLVKTE